jgi:hypothetical protein
MNRTPTANHTKSFFHKTKRVFKKYFIAHEDNDHHPHIFRTRAVLSFLFCVLAIEGGLFLYTDRPVEINSQKAAVIANALISYTNDARSTENLGSLTRNPALDLAAKKKADDMIARGYFAHFSPDGVSPWHWIDEVGYRYETAGENLAIDFFDSKDVVDAWLKSPGHRKNIMKQKYTEIGMAVAEGNFENRHTTFVVQFFAAPAVAVAVQDIPASSTVIPVPAPVITPTPSTRIVPAPAQVIAITPSVATSAATTTELIALATTSTSTEPVAPVVAGINTENDMDESLFARITNDMFGFTASPRNTVETVLFILIACIILATLIYMHGSKNPAVHRIVAIVSISLTIIIILCIMMNRTFLRMSEDDIGPGAETALETGSDVE